MNAYATVAEFERRVADYAGAPYAVAVDCCSNAIFLCCVRRHVRGERVYIPARTYISVAAAIIHAGGEVVFQDYPWVGMYQLRPFGIIDGAKRFRPDMYTGGLHCLSFHVKKHIPIGRGGMILCHDEADYEWLRRARYDGREGKPYAEEQITTLGWHAYMTPEQAARGLTLMDALPPDDLPDLTEDYPDLREMPVFKCKSPSTLTTT